MPRSDFNGDGRDDVLWRNDEGTVSNWLGTANGGFIVNDVNATNTLWSFTSYLIIGTGDFNGDGFDDVLARYRWSPSDLDVLLGTNNGGFVSANFLSFVGRTPKVSAIGDFDNDGSDDLVVTSGGNLSVWTSTEIAQFVPSAMTATYSTDWKIAGSGDFDGDGHDDLLWRNSNGYMSDWLGTGSGFTVNDANALVQVPTSWHIAGIGDFNGDGRDDILWRNDNGALSNWLGEADGGFMINDANAFQMVPTDWEVAGVGDYNGNGFDDILWRNSVTGDVSNWLGQVNGGFVINDANAYLAAPLSWEIQPIDGTLINWGITEP